jgi:hypothetical protein
MSDGQVPLFLLSEGNELVTLIELQAHGFFQQHMAARFERRPGHLVMQVRRDDDVHRFELLPLEHLAVIGIEHGVGVLGLGRGAGRLRRFGHGSEPGARRLGDGAGVLAPPGAAADQPKANRSFFSGNHTF